MLRHLVGPLALLTSLVPVTLASPGDPVSTSAVRPPGSFPAPVLVADPPTADTLRVTLERALDLALAGRPAILAADQEVLAADAARRQARAWSNPGLFVEAEGFAGDRAGFGEAELTVGVEAPLDLFGRAGAEGHLADARFERERVRGQILRRGVEAEVRLAFHEVLAAREDRRIASRRLAMFQASSEAIASQVEAGRSAALRGIQAEASLEAARARSEITQADLRQAERRLAGLLGDEVGPVRPVAVTGDLRGDPPPLARDALAGEILSHHPAILDDLWRAEVERRLAGRIGRHRWPEVNLALGYRRHLEGDVSDFVGGLSFDLPLFDRGTEAVRAAHLREQAAVNDSRDLARSLLTELDRRLEACRGAAAVLARYDEEVRPRSTEALRLARLGYSEGKLGYLDLMDAERTWIDAEAERARAAVSLDRSLVELEILLGRGIDDPPAARENRP